MYRTTVFLFALSFSHIASSGKPNSQSNSKPSSRNCVTVESIARGVLSYALGQTTNLRYRVHLTLFGKKILREMNREMEEGQNEQNCLSLSSVKENTRKLAGKYIKKGFVDITYRQIVRGMSYGPDDKCGTPLFEKAKKECITLEEDHLDTGIIKMSAGMHVLRLMDNKTKADYVMLGHAVKWLNLALHFQKCYALYKCVEFGKGEKLKKCKKDFARICTSLK